MQLGLKALKMAKAAGPLPYSQPANRSFFEAARGLVWCLAKLDMLVKRRTRGARREADPRDPLELRKLLDDDRRRDCRWSTY